MTAMTTISSTRVKALAAGPRTTDDGLRADKEQRAAGLAECLCWLAVRSALSVMSFRLSGARAGLGSEKSCEFGMNERIAHLPFGLGRGKTARIKRRWYLREL